MVYVNATPWPNAAETVKAYLVAAVEGNKNGASVFVEGYTPAYP